MSPKSIHTEVFNVIYRLIVQHGDGLNGLDRMVELDDGVAAGLAVLVATQLDGDDSSGQTENFAKLLLVDSVHQLQNKQTFFSLQKL